MQHARYSRVLRLTAFYSPCHNRAAGFDAGTSPGSPPTITCVVWAPDTCFREGLVADSKDGMYLPETPSLFRLRTRTAQY